jgi:glutathionyl-hydroquinone reductase
MGYCNKGVWTQQSFTTDDKGIFVREDSQIRNWVGKGADSLFPAKKHKYHLYVSLACPWAHRVLIMRSLKGLESIVGVSIVHPHMENQGWTFQKDDFATGDLVNDFKYMHQLYTHHNNDYTGRVTVPVLWDCEQQCIVNNESSDIMRMFNSAFNDLIESGYDYYPENLRSEIDALNDYIYNCINNGVYRCGFATSQLAYESACVDLFAALEVLEKRLAGSDYLFKGQLTESDWRLFTTLIRFDVVYYGHFKTNIKKISDFPNLSDYLKRLYEYPGIKETVCFMHIKGHYYYSHKQINPSRIVPLGPEKILND